MVGGDKLKIAPAFSFNHRTYAAKTQNSPAAHKVSAKRFEGTVNPIFSNLVFLIAFSQTRGTAAIPARSEIKYGINRYGHNLHISDVL